MTPEANIAGVRIFRVEDRCFVRLEQMIAWLPDTSTRSELLRYLWTADLDADDE